MLLADVGTWLTAIGITLFGVVLVFGLIVIILMAMTAILPQRPEPGDGVAADTGEPTEPGDDSQG